MDISLNRAETIFFEFEKKLIKVNKKELNFKLTKNLFTAVVVFITAAFILILLESIFSFGTKVRMFFYWGFVLTLAATFSYNISNYILRISNIIKPFNIIDFSRRIGRKFQSIKDSLSNSLSLFKFIKLNGNSGIYYSSELITASLEAEKNKTQNINFNSTIPYNIFRKLLLFLTGIIFIYVITFLFFPSALSSSLNRIINYKFNFIGEYGIKFDIQPGNIESFKGDKVLVKIKVIMNKPGLKINELNFYTKNVTTEGINVPVSEKVLKPDENEIFTTEIENISSSLIYYAEFKGINSDEYKITLADYPVIKNFKITIIPPDFTGLPQKVLDENQGDIYCIQGSRVSFEINANVELSKAGIIFNGNFSEFSVDGKSANGEVVITDNGNYKFSIADKEGIQSKNQNVYDIKIIKNEPPKITIIQPRESNYMLAGEKNVTLRAIITDDFGFSKLTLGFRKFYANSTASNIYSVISVPLKNPDATSLEVPYVWDLSVLNLRVGESVEYYMEVTDNTGNTTRSDVRTISYKSLSDMLKKTVQFTQDVRQNLKSMKEYLEDIQKEIKDARNDSKNTQDLGLNDPAKNKELQNKIENLKNSLEATQNKIDNAINELEKRNVLDEKTYEKYMQLQELYNKINTPEFQEKLKKLQEALKKNNPDEIRDAMKNMNFDEEAFKKQIEQLMELLKKIENLQKLAELTQRLDEIKKDQEALKQETENTDANNRTKMDELSGKQNSLQDKMNEFKEDLNNLLKNVKDTKDEFDSKSLEKLKNKLDSKDVKSKMQKSSNQLQNGNKKESEDTQQDIINDLEELNDDMQDTFDNAMNSNLNEKEINKLKDIKRNIDELSKEQQDLKEKTEDIKKSQKEELNNSAKEQNNLQNKLNQDINDLMELSQSGLPISPELGKEFGNAYNSMDKAQSQLGKGEKDDAVGNQGKAKTSLDNASKMLDDLIKSLEQQGKQKGKGNSSNQGRMGQLMKRLSDLIGKQQSVNGEMQKFGENGQKGNNGKGGQEELTQEQKIKLDRLKLEQQNISKSLEELNAEFEKEKEKTGEKLLGDLNEVNKEMKEIIKDMGDYKVDKDLLEKQNRILSRMLDAQLSQREKDFEQKRESKPGEDMVRSSPPEIILSGPKSFNAFKEDFLKLQKQGYTEEYEALITKYLMEIKKQ